LQEPTGLPRWLEASTAGVALVLLAPVLASCAAAIVVASGRPAFFRQARVGRGGRPFTLIKLRTMATAAGDRRVEITASGDARVTTVGRLLRRTKLDELPELWNVLRGDMSWVGPRPEVPSQVDLENPAWQRVLSARPGLTDPVTLRLRNEEALLADVPVDQRDDFYRRVLQPWKLRGYVAYLERRNAFSDLAVLGQTLLAILRPSTQPPPGLDELSR
jgi:lipopolysaccharide/colanic/teichoic acid biosynthesis glycosyltransferase